MGYADGLRASPTLGFCAGARPDGVVQFSAPITSETVGGGVFDLSGGLVGVITGGIGFGRWAEAGVAVPAREIPAIVRHLLRRGDRLAGYIGVTTTDIEISPGIELTLPNRLAQAVSQRSELIERGIMVTSVVPFSPAARAGLRKGDLLFSMNGAALSSSLDLKSQVRSTLPGTLSQIGFLRHNVPYQAHVRVGQLELGSDDFLGAAVDGVAPGTPPVDSLLREINPLKRTLLHLERRLRGLK